MTKKELEIQKALGLLQVYDGYVKVKGSDYFDVYTVEDVTLAGATRQIAAIVANVEIAYIIVLLF